MILFCKNDIHMHITMITKHQNNLSKYAMNYKAIADIRYWHRVVSPYGEA